MAWLDDGLSVSIAQLRIEEALAFEKADFRDNGAILRVYQQATRDGQETAPLKKRKRGEYRDIPVPTWLWDMIRDLPYGPLMIGNGERRYQLYGTVYERFMNAADKAGIPAGFTPNAVKLSGTRLVIHISTGPVLNSCGFRAIGCHLRPLALDWRGVGTWSSR